MVRACGVLVGTTGLAVDELADLACTELVVERNGSGVLGWADGLGAFVELAFAGICTGMIPLAFSIPASNWRTPLEDLTMRIQPWQAGHLYQSV